jgi:hypothetical protein
MFPYFSQAKTPRPSCLRSFNGNARYSKFNHHNVGKMSKPSLNVITGAIGDCRHVSLFFLRNCVVSKYNGRFFSNVSENQSTAHGRTLFGLLRRAQAVKTFPTV